MSDIDRLIADARVKGCDVCDGLADEITRLRAELAAWKAEAEAWRKWWEAPWTPDDSKADVLFDLVKVARAATDAIEKESPSE